MKGRRRLHDVHCRQFRVSLRAVEQQKTLTELRAHNSDILRRKIQTLNDKMPATSEIHMHGPCSSSEGQQEPAERKKAAAAAFSLFCDERGYLNQIEYILQNGVKKGDRTGTGVLSVFGSQARYSLRGGLQRPTRTHFTFSLQPVLFIVKWL